MDADGVTQVRVAYRRMVSDGNYGNETAEVEFVASVPDGEDGQPTALALLAHARSVVEDRLRASKNDQVAEAMMTTAEREAKWKRDSEERRRKLDEQLVKEREDPQDTPF